MEAQLSSKTEATFLPHYMVFYPKLLYSSRCIYYIRYKWQLIKQTEAYKLCTQVSKIWLRLCNLSRISKIHKQNSISGVLILQNDCLNFYLPVVPSVLPITKDIFFHPEGWRAKEKNKNKTLINITAIPHNTTHDKKTTLHNTNPCSPVHTLLVCYWNITRNC